MFHFDFPFAFIAAALLVEYAIATANRYIELKPLARILESTRKAKE
jgi:hypothetical protein